MPQKLLSVPSCLPFFMFLNDKLLPSPAFLTLQGKKAVARPFTGIYRLNMKVVYSHRLVSGVVRLPCPHRSYSQVNSHIDSNIDNYTRKAQLSRSQAKKNNSEHSPCDTKPYQTSYRGGTLTVPLLVLKSHEGISRLFLHKFV